MWRHHAFFTTTPAGVADTVAADKVHRAHAIIEQVHADLKSSALAHLPSKSFAANSAWLTLAVMAFNLTQAAATLTGQRRLARATTATLRRTLIHVPARSRPPPEGSPCTYPGLAVAAPLAGAVGQRQHPTRTSTDLTTQPPPAARPGPPVEHSGSEAGGPPLPRHNHPAHPRDADTGHIISAGQARRLACNAGLVPAVLGGPSLPLDLGRADRFFTQAQTGRAGHRVHRVRRARV